jgi:hypothetical protein
MQSFGTMGRNRFDIDHEFKLRINRDTRESGDRFHAGILDFEWAARLLPQVIQTPVPA